MSNPLSSSETSAFFKVPTLKGLEDFHVWKSAITDLLLMLSALDIVEGRELMSVDGTETTI